jgi:hypothetical protein
MPTIVLVWLSQGGLDWQDIQHAWGNEKGVQNDAWEVWSDLDWV